MLLLLLGCGCGDDATAGSNAGTADGAGGGGAVAASGNGGIDVTAVAAAGGGGGAGGAGGSDLSGAAAVGGGATGGSSGAGGGGGSDATTCPGGYLDVATSLCWENPPKDDRLTLAEATAYCEALTAGGQDGWCVPNVDEARSLIRNCPATETGGSLRRAAWQRQRRLRRLVHRLHGKRGRVSLAS
ncbi:MAG: hypothetical protein OEZ06_15355 [Myxococcales bacterium]|nr:hypothetical protein [Myxococcales bacterium]